MAIEAISKRISEGEIKLPMDNPVVIDALRRGDIQGLHKLLSDYGITIGDFEQFAASQHNKYINQVVQAEPLYEGHAGVPPPQIENFPQFDMSSTLSQEDKKMAAEMFVGKAMSAAPSGGAGKAAIGKAAQAKSSATPDMSNMQGHYDGAMDELDNLNNIIMEAQFTQELQNKSAELEDQLQKILAMARSGQIEDPSIIILALAKVQVEKNGLVFTQLGKKVMNTNDQMNKAYDMLKNDSSMKNQYAAKQKIQTGTQGLQFLINDMNQVAQHIQSVIGFSKSSIDAMKAAKDEIIRKLTASGG